MGFTTMTRSDRAKKKASMHGDGHSVPEIIRQMETELEELEVLERAYVESCRAGRPEGADVGRQHRIAMLKIDLDSLYENWFAGEIE